MIDFRPPGASARRLLPPSPYPGLRPFDRHEGAIFFGREAMVEELTGKLAAQRLVVVHGSSGCGKSSLVRAGALPALELRGQIGGRPWLSIVVRPAGGPLKNLAAELETLFPTQPQPSLAPAEPGETLKSQVARFVETDDARAALGLDGLSWRERLALGPAVLPSLDRAIADRAGEGGRANLCIVIDQFEELFRWTRDNGPEDGQGLIEILKAVARQDERASIFVLLTMRSDFIGECARFEGFAETVNACQYLLPRMDTFALMRAIEEPAALFGGGIDAAVTERLIQEARREVDALPLMQHALLQAAIRAHGEASGGWRVSPEHLDAVSGSSGALATHLDSVWAEAVGNDPAAAEALEWIFRTLTSLDSDRRGLRRPSTLAELVEVSGVERTEVERLVTAFARPGRNFLSVSPSGSLSDESVVEISHEALIRSWPRLSDRGTDPTTGEVRGLVMREFQDGMVWRALAVQAKTFDGKLANSLPPEIAGLRLPWYRSLQRRPGWVRRHLIETTGQAAPQDEPEWRDVANLMDTSLRRLEQAQSASARRRRMATVAAAAAVVLVAVVTFALYAQGQTSRREATRNAALATTNAISAQTQKADVVRAEETLKSLTQALEAEGRLAEVTAAAKVVFVYLHITDESQRAAAEALGRDLDGKPVGDLRVAVPGVERVNVTLRTTQLRCFRASECDAAQPLLRQIQALVPGQSVKLSRMDRTYEGRAPEGQYELWLASPASGATASTAPPQGSRLSPDQLAAYVAAARPFLSKWEGAAPADNEIRAVVEGVYALVTVPLTDNQMTGLTSFAYNIGLGGFKKSAALDYVNLGDFQTAAQSLRNWRSPRSGTIPTQRRAAEAALLIDAMSRQKTQKQTAF